MPAYVEGDIEVAIPDGRTFTALDRMHARPHGMALVDLVLFEDDRILLLEVKDPAQPRARERNRRAFLERLNTDGYVNEKLTPKARDSYTYLHLMKQDDRPMLFVVLLGADGEMVPPMELEGLQVRLRRRLLREADQPWRRPYVTDCIVATPETWPRHFPDLALRRLSSRREPEDGDTDR